MKLWGCFSAAGPGRLTNVGVKMSATKFRDILWEKSILEQAKSPNSKPKLNKNGFKTKNVIVLMWPSPSSDLSPIHNQ